VPSRHAFQLLLQLLLLSAQLLLHLLRCLQLLPQRRELSLSSGGGLCSRCFVSSGS
jgi:hypothetical protein